eukprot:COSAG06_NODE_17927_length_914_cov_0.817178_1_plen_201_part_01
MPGAPPQQQEQALTAAMERSVVAMLWRVIRGKRQLYGQTVSDIRSFFEAADRDASGRLTLPELAEAFTRLDVDLAPKDMERAFASIDIDGEGDLDYRELRRWMTKRDGTQAEESGVYEGCTIQIDGLEGELSEHTALVQAFSHFGEIIACDVVIPHAHDEVRIPWALVTYAKPEGAELAKAFSADRPPVASMSPAELESMA